MAPRPARQGARPSASFYLSFYLLQTLRLVSSGVVIGQLGYFFWWLRHDHYPWPWTFIILSVASSLTTVEVIVVTAASLFGVTRPSLNVVANACLSILWVVGMGMLIHYARPTITGPCDEETWDNNGGISVCKIYKSLFTFTVLGLACNIAALVVEFATHTDATRRGSYQPMMAADTNLDPADDPWAVPIASERDMPSRSFEEPTREGGYVDSVSRAPRTDYEGGLFNRDLKGQYMAL